MERLQMAEKTSDDGCNKRCTTGIMGDSGAGRDGQRRRKGRAGDSGEEVCTGKSGRRGMRGVGR